MNIDEEFLTENNITKEEYEDYYNSLEVPKAQKEVNEYGLITLTIDLYGICFREEDMSEEEALMKVESKYRQGTTNIHFRQLTEQNKPKEEPKVEEPILSEVEEAILNTDTNVEYLVALQELSYD